MQYNIDMRLKDMLEDQRCVEVMDRFLPGIVEKIQANPMGGTLSLRMVAQFTKGMIT